MPHRRHWLLFLGLAAAASCKAGVNDAFGGAGGAGAGHATSTSEASTTATVTTGTGFMTVSGTGGTGGIPINPCGTACGDTELCDGVHKGLDDNCDGVVDEGCPCRSGEAESCFKGDPSYLNNGSCFPGTQHCSENGTWSTCMGGSQPTDDPPCFSADPLGCHPISSVPFATADLATGCGNFDDNADVGSSDWSIMCPAGVNPCPTADATGHVQFVASGEYTVTYSKNVAGVPEMCTYPVYVGAPGLRVELSWEFADTDIDLHMHEPGTTTPFSQYTNPDCGYSNCKVYGYQSTPVTGANWFPPAPQPPNQPVDWDLNPNFNENTCYFAPNSYGAMWQAIGKGCHNPRLDLDNTGCNLSVTDPNDPGYCSPENINVDIPPPDVWTRIAVHYYSAHFNNETLHPNVKIYCNGALSAELGSGGFGNPEAPITWTLANDDVMWTVADVKFTSDGCTSTTCTVRPLYVNDDMIQKQPIYQPGYGGAFGPAYLP